MKWELIQKIFGEHINKGILWAKDDTRRLITTSILVFLFAVILLPRIVLSLNKIKLLDLINLASIWIYTNSNSQWFILSALTIGILCYLLVFRNLSSLSKNIFEVNIEKEPDIWSYYKGAGFSIVDDSQSWNKVIKLGNSSYPIILKFGNDWLNYKLTFEAKIPSSVDKTKQNFTFVVRAKDKGNNIFFQCRPDGTITPHFLTNGLFIIDQENQIKFLTEFPLDDWISMCVIVKGNEVEIASQGVRVTYKIPSTSLRLKSEQVQSTMYLSEVQKDTEANAHGSGLGILAFDLDYEKGTIGFRESDAELALFRDIKIELLPPFYK